VGFEKMVLRWEAYLFAVSFGVMHLSKEGWVVEDLGLPAMERSRE